MRKMDMCSSRPVCRVIHGQRGVALLEALIALLIFSMGILAVVGLQANALRNTTEARLRIDASYFADQILGQMWVDRANLASYAGSSTIPELPDGVRTVAVSGTQVTVSIDWKTANGAPHHYTTVTRIEGST